MPVTADRAASRGILHPDLAADSGEQVDWAELAADLGYADQAHLTRDFTVTIGVSPARYASPVTGS